ncbi:MAG: PorT family protein [Bacteroidales bacterium]|nr:PorT family protein [Bacteroidales bacterium]
MKKLVIAAIASFFAISALAQPGILAGLTTMETDYETAWANVKEVNQYHVGVTFKLPLPLGFAVQPAILYNVKGQTLEDTATDGSLKSIDMKTGLLEVAAQAQWGINFAGVVRPYVFAEPFVGYAITNEEKVSGLTANLTGENSKEEWENVKNRLEYGFGIGFGVEILNHLQVAVRKYWNMGELYNEDGSAITSFKQAINAGSTAVEEKTASGIMASVIFLF